MSFFARRVSKKNTGHPHTWQAEYQHDNHVSRPNELYPKTHVMQCRQAGEGGGGEVELTNTICLFDELFRLLGEREREEKPPG
jgi:hypothetical protein